MDFVNFLRGYINECHDTLIQPICTILLNPLIHSDDFKFIKKLLNPHLCTTLVLEQYNYIISVYELSLLPQPQVRREITYIKNDENKIFLYVLQS